MTWRIVALLALLEVPAHAGKVGDAFKEMKARTAVKVDALKSVITGGPRKYETGSTVSLRSASVGKSGSVLRENRLFSVTASGGLVPKLQVKTVRDAQGQKALRIVDNMKKRIVSMPAPGGSGQLRQTSRLVMFGGQKYALPLKARVLNKLGFSRAQNERTVLSQVLEMDAPVDGKLPVKVQISVAPEKDGAPIRETGNVLLTPGERQRVIDNPELTHDLEYTKDQKQVIDTFNAKSSDAKTASAQFHHVEIQKVEFKSGGARVVTGMLGYKDGKGKPMVRTFTQTLRAGQRVLDMGTFRGAEVKLGFGQKGLTRLQVRKTTIPPVPGELPNEVLFGKPSARSAEIVTLAALDRLLANTAKANKKTVRDGALASRALRLTTERGRSLPNRPGKRDSLHFFHGGEVKIRVFTDTSVSLDGKPLPSVAIQVFRRNADGDYVEVARRSPGHKDYGDLRPEIANQYFAALTKEKIASR